MARRRRSATYASTLVYVDGPQLIELDSRTAKVVAVSVPDDDREFPFLATVISPRDWDRYIRGMVDLRFLFVYSKKESLFTFDLSKMRADETISMDPIEESDVPKEWLPDRKFFSRDHTEPVDSPRERLVGRQTFLIDGEWALPDFSHFYGKFSDIYAFEMSIGKFMDRDATDGVKADIVRAFKNYPFRGGSSYGNFYKDLSGVLTLGEQPGVEGVRYESPGYVAIRGRQDVFDKISSSIANFQGNFVEIKKAYNHLHSHLSKLRYLRASPAQFDNNTPTANTIMGEAKALAVLLKLERFDLIQDLCAGNALVVAKIVLSYSRRIEGAFDFFAEGRASFAE